MKISIFSSNDRALVVVAIIALSVVPLSAVLSAFFMIRDSDQRDRRIEYLEDNCIMRHGAGPPP